MQKVKLPKRLDPIKSAVKRSEYQGIVMASDMPRLTEAVADVAETVDVNVKFEKDAQGLTFFRGSMATTVELICQRCNNSFQHDVEAEFCFSPVQGQESVDELPEAYDPVEVDDHGEIDLLQLFEDELILALPIVALHAEEDCSVKESDMSFGEIEPENERPNPFAVLKELKRD